MATRYPMNTLRTVNQSREPSTYNQGVVEQPPPHSLLSTLLFLFL